METTHHQHNCDAQMTTLLGEVRNGVRFLVLQYTLHQTGVPTVDARTCRSTFGARDGRCGRMKGDNQSLGAPLDPINGER